MLNNSIKFIKESLIGKQTLNKLNSLEFSETGTRRLCLHEDNDAKLHLMLISIKRDVKYPFHKHLDSNEIIVIIEGKLDIIFKNNPKKNILLSKDNQNHCVMIKKNEVHQVTTSVNNTIFLEIKCGPFKKSNLKIVK